jgi:hypothetical protein
LRPQGLRLYGIGVAGTTTTVSFFGLNADGTLKSPVNTPFSLPFVSTTFGDVNGDGYTDMVASSFGGQWQLYTGKPGGGFNSPTHLNLAGVGATGVSYGMTIGTLPNGKTGLVAEGFIGSQNTITILPFNSDGTQASPVTTLTGTSDFAFSIAVSGNTLYAAYSTAYKLSTTNKLITFTINSDSTLSKVATTPLTNTPSVLAAGPIDPGSNDAFLGYSDASKLTYCVPSGTTVICGDVQLSGPFIAITPDPHPACDTGNNGPCTATIVGANGALYYSFGSPPILVPAPSLSILSSQLNPVTSGATIAQNGVNSPVVGQANGTVTVGTPGTPNPDKITTPTGTTLHVGDQVCWTNNGDYQHRIRVLYNNTYLGSGGYEVIVPPGVPAPH